MLKDREEFYINLIKTSVSLIEVCRKANIVPTTGNYITLKRIISKNNIDISHFKRNCGNANNIKKKTEDYLVKGSIISSFKLKNRLLDEGYKEHSCENPLCQLTEWNGKPIPLELHHINGDNTDNRLENLQLLCPNCHAQTDSFGGRNQKLNVSKKEKKKRGLNENEIADIIKESLINESIKDIALKTKHSQKTIKSVLKEKNITVNKNTKIKKENDKKLPLILESLKKTKSFSATAREFGVSDNAIKKLLVRRGFPKHIKDILSKIT